VRQVDDAAEWWSFDDAVEWSKDHHSAASSKDHLAFGLLYVRPNQGRQLVMNKRWFAAAEVIGNSPHTGA